MPKLTAIRSEAAALAPGGSSFVGFVAIAYLVSWCWLVPVALSGGSLLRDADGPPIYLRWWALVWEAANRHGENKGMQIADIADLVEAPIEEIWPFLDWSGRTQRSVACLGGKDGLGSISLRSLQGCFPTGEVPTAQSQSLVGS